MFNTKNAAKEEPYRVVYRSPYGGFAEPATRTQALEAFTLCVSRAYITPDNGRHLTVMSEAEYQKSTGGTR